MIKELKKELSSIREPLFSKNKDGNEPDRNAYRSLSRSLNNCAEDGFQPSAEVIRQIKNLIKKYA
jgi:hypothetical protein